MSPGKDQEYFSDGLADELISDLARIPDLRVTARTSSFQFKGKSDDLRSIGRQLNVRSILEGSVRKDADRLRITVQLINVQDGFHVWSETYDRKTSDIFAVQEEIARSVANALRVTLLPGRVYSPKPTSPEAYSAYLQGRYSQSTGDWQRASGYYQQAVRLDPSFAPAWAWLGSVYYSLANTATIPQQEGFQKSREAVQQALKLDPESADAHRVLGSIKLSWDWDWSGADAELRRALELEPNNVYSLSSGMAVSLLFGRCADALEFARRGVELNPMRAGGYNTLATALWECGNLDDTVSALKKVLELDPKSRRCHYRLGKAYYYQGKFPDALAQMEQETDPMNRLLGLTLVYHKMGDQQESDAALQGLVERYQVGSSFQIAEAYACRGEPDNALRWLQTAYDRHDSGLAGIKIAWCFRNIQSDARYQRFLRKMNLPQ
jgi:serine/threonine-protein kinase